MKLTKLSLLFSIGVMLAIAATGCKNPKYGVTPLGDRAATSGSGQGQLPGGGMLPPGENPQSQPGFGGGEAATFNPDDFNQDRAALAAQTVYFDYDSSSIRPSEQSKLDAVVAALSADASAKLLVEGHCDERGTEEYNRSLGERRALAAREVLAAH